MSSRTKTLYIGMTNDLERRLGEHKAGMTSFTSRYNIDKLVYYEESDSIRAAIQREKQLKSWRREKKVALIESDNPDWDDLADAWYSGERDSSLRSERRLARASFVIPSRKYAVRRTRARNLSAPCTEARP